MASFRPPPQVAHGPKGDIWTMVSNDSEIMIKSKQARVHNEINRICVGQCGYERTLARRKKT